MYIFFICPFWSRCYYPHKSRDSVSPICRILMFLVAIVGCLVDWVEWLTGEKFELPIFPQTKRDFGQEKQKYISRRNYVRYKSIQGCCDERLEPATLGLSLKTAVFFFLFFCIFLVKKILLYFSLDMLCPSFTAN